MSSHHADTTGALIGAGAIGRFLGLTEEEVHALAAAQKIPHRWFGSRLSASRAELAAWLKERDQAAAAT